MQTIFELNQDGTPTGLSTTIADEHGVSEGWATSPPPTIVGLDRAVWRGSEWVVLPPADPVDPVANLLAYNEGQRLARARAYRIEADPIFMQSQRGDATNEQWLAAIDAIKTRFPYA